MKFHFDSEYWIVWDYANTNSLHYRGGNKTSPSDANIPTELSELAVTTPGDTNTNVPTPPPIEPKKK